MHEVERYVSPAEDDGASERSPVLGWLEELEETDVFRAPADLRAWYLEPARRPEGADEGPRGG